MFGRFAGNKSAALNGAAQKGMLNIMYVEQVSRVTSTLLVKETAQYGFSAKTILINPPVLFVPLHA